MAETFEVAFDKQSIFDLQDRLKKARWPAADIIGEDEADSSSELYKAHFVFKWGPSLKLMKELSREWQQYLVGQFPRDVQKMNKVPHFMAQIENLKLHFVHVKSRRSDATPLVLCHGWPGSFIEFTSIADQLANPPNATDRAFHVVIPSMPGFTFSSQPPSSKWQMQDTARLFDKLMTDVLGYTEYYAQGGDWGSITARMLGSLHPACKGVHLNFCPVPPSAPLSWINPKLILNWAPRLLLSDDDRKRLETSVAYLEDGSAYYMMQDKTPRTPAYGLHDSPIGLLAWLGEKVEPSIARAQKTRSDADLTRRELFLTCTLYWLTGTIMSSFTPYAFNRHFAEYLVDKTFWIPNMAVSHFPFEIAAVPQGWVAKTGKLRWYKVAERGGHFASLEEPEIFVAHVREAVSVLAAHKQAKM